MFVIELEDEFEPLKSNLITPSLLTTKLQKSFIIIHFQYLKKLQLYYSSVLII